MNSSVSVREQAVPTRTLRVGSVSFLNAKPLIHGLDEAEDVELSLAVPSRLLEGLRSGAMDVALLPVIDYQAMEGLRIVPSGGIGSDGETLTVRIFSKVPLERIARLACDTDSHTSVALARVIFAERYGRVPELVDWEHDQACPCEARLLIGDKVVCEEPVGFAHQMDLGQLWKELTGLPFLFAVWTARGGVDLRDLPQRLEQAKRAGLAAVNQIVGQCAVPRGWPVELALQYLTVNLKFDVGAVQLEAIRRFHELAARHGIIASPVRPLKLYSPV